MHLPEIPTFTHRLFTSRNLNVLGVVFRCEIDYPKVRARKSTREWPQTTIRGVWTMVKNCTISALGDPILYPQTRSFVLNVYSRSAYSFKKGLASKAVVVIFKSGENRPKIRACHLHLRTSSHYLSRYGRKFYLKRCACSMCF